MIQIHVVRTHNVHVLVMESLNVLACTVTLKARTRFEDVLNQRIHVNRTHADWEHLVTYREIQFVIAQNQLSVIYSNNAVHQLLFESFVSLDHVAKMLTAMLRIVVNNAIVDQDTLAIHTAVAMSHQDQFANQIHAAQMLNALFKRMVNLFAIVHLEWAAMLIVLVVAMDINAIQMKIVV